MSKLVMAVDRGDGHGFGLFATARKSPTLRVVQPLEMPWRYGSIRKFGAVMGIHNAGR
jgi:hypothetical protein